MATRNPNPNPKRKTSVWSYILPYLVMAIAIIFFVALIFGRRENPNQVNVSQNQITLFVESNTELDEGEPIIDPNGFSFDIRHKNATHKITNYSILGLETTTTTTVVYLNGELSAFISASGER